MSFLCTRSKSTVFLSERLAKGSPVLLKLLGCQARKANVSVKVYLCHYYVLFGRKSESLVIFVMLEFFCRID